MSRALTPGMLGEVDAASLRPVLFYEGEFESGLLNLWTGVGPIPWDGKTWLGAGNLVGISPIKETASIVAAGITCSLSGMPSSLIALVHDEARHGKPGSVWIGALDASGNVIADPYMAFSGWLDVPQMEDAGETCTIAVSYESRLIDLQRARLFRWDHETQQHFYPDDRGFEYSPNLPDQVVVW
jgi:hypothetical protein